MDKFVISAHNTETRFADFSLDCRRSCLVFPGRAHPIHYDETPSGTKGTGQMRQYFFGGGQLMVGIGNQDGICGSARQVRIINIADDRLNVVLPLQESSDSQE